MTSSYNPITGTSSADSLFRHSADSIDALGGDDIVYGGSESDIVALGTGNDSINSADADGAKIYGQGGNDSLGFTASLNTSTVSGGTANDHSGFPKHRIRLWRSRQRHHRNQLDFSGASVFGGNLSDATSSDGSDSISVSSSASAAYAAGNGGNDTLYIAGKILSDSSVFGGQGNDSIDSATTLSSSYLTGNLGNTPLWCFARVQPFSVVVASCSIPPRTELTHFFGWQPQCQLDDSGQRWQ